MRQSTRFLFLLDLLQLVAVVHSFTSPLGMDKSLRLPVVSSLSTSVETTNEQQPQPHQQEQEQRGGISMSIDELSAVLGGSGRAKLCWDLYSIGVDPANYFASPNASQEEEDREKITKLLPSGRRHQWLGKESLQRLADLYPQPYGGQVEGGVASLSDITTSRDLTTKLLLRLYDGLEVETVIIPWEGVRSTLCISSQVGCSQGCKFCATGRMGKLRSLISDEILAQMFFAQKIVRLHQLPRIANIVFMGLGEPSDNANHVVRATQILASRGTFQLSAAKITVSTVAPNPSSFNLFCNASCVLAWSVHAVNDKLRKRLVPTTQYSMHELRQGLIDAMNARPMNLRTVMLEIVLLKDVNDDLEHADELANFAKVIVDSVPGCKLVINLIPYNPITDGVFEKPSLETTLAFQQQILNVHGLYAFVRVTRGDDESAACGQLVTSKKKQVLSPENSMSA